MRRWPWICLVVIGLTFAACGGGDDDAQPFGDAGADPTTAPTSAPAGNVGGNGGGGAVNAFVTAGDESFEFTVECQFGTGIIRGGGSSADGTPAFLDAGMAIADDGKPVNNPDDIDVSVYVGKDIIFGPSLYEYVLRGGDDGGFAVGSVSSYSDDGSHAEGIIQFEYFDKDSAKEGLTYGDLVAGTFKVTCP